jgi:hypothetical protein
VPAAQLFAKGSLGELTLSQADFNARVHAALAAAGTTGEVVVIRRECARCGPQHRDVYYKRLTDKTTFDAHGLLLETWSSANNVLNRDFALYSSLDDAANGWNAWSFCNYDDQGVAFPRDCGPSGSVGWQWNSLTRGGQGDVRFTLVTAEAPTTALPTPPGPPEDDEIPPSMISHWFSEEEPNISEDRSSAITAIECKGSYCGNMRLKFRPTVTVVGNFWTDWFSAETAGFTSCPAGQAVARIQCEGRACGNLRLLCSAPLWPAVLLEASTETAFFSAETAGFTECPVGQVLTGIECRGRRCDNKRMQCAEITGARRRRDGVEADDESSGARFTIRGRHA